MTSYRLITAFAISALLASCAKESSSGDIRETKSISVIMPSITSKTAFGTEAEGRMPLLWKSGDEITVAYAPGTSEERTAIYALEGDGGNSQGTFKYKSGDPGEFTITDIFYPASSVSDRNVPGAQTYREGGFDPKAALMSWHGPGVTAGSPVFLKNDASIICFQLKSANGADVKKISVTLAYSETDKRTYTLSCQNVVLGEDATPFYIAVQGRNDSCKVQIQINHSATVENISLTDRSFVAGELRRFSERDIVAAQPDGSLPDIGDLYQGGVVFETNNTYVKVVSLKESPTLCWSTESISTGCTESQDDGLEYTLKILSLPSYSSETYPAAAWCTSLGEGWYLPSTRELVSIRKNLIGINSSADNENPQKMAAANALMASYDGDPFNWGMYWSSRENASDNNKAWVSRLNKVIDDNYRKINITGYNARAVKKIIIN